MRHAELQRDHQPKNSDCNTWGPCKTAETMERNRLYRRDHPHHESPEARKKSNRKYRISSYGLTQELFDLLLEAQQNACGMCHEPFEERQLIHVDHDHAC